MTTTLTDVEHLREANRVIARTWMTTLGEPAWWGLMHDDIVFEFPYAPSLGRPDRVEGKAAAVAYAQALFARLGDLKFANLEITGTTDPNVFFGEYSAKLSTPSGENYTQVYINKLRIEDGKVVLMKEFWDPKRILDAANGHFSMDQ